MAKMSATKKGTGYGFPAFLVPPKYPCDWEPRQEPSNFMSPFEGRWLAPRGKFGRYPPGKILCRGCTPLVGDFSASGVLNFAPERDGDVELVVDPPGGPPSDIVRRGKLHRGMG